MQFIGAVVILLLLVGGTAGYARHRVNRIAASGTPGARKAAKGAQKQALKVGEKAAAVLAEAHATDWLERRRRSRERADSRRVAAGRAARATAAGTGTAIRATARGTRSAGRAAVQRLVVSGGAWNPGAQAPARSNGHATAPAAAPPSSSPAAQPAQPAVASTTPSGRTRSPMTTTSAPGSSGGVPPWPGDSDSAGAAPRAAAGAAAAGGAGADLFTAIQGLTSRIKAGNLRAKQGGITAVNDGLDYISHALASLARELSEPGQGYGAPIWEPIATAAAHVKAGASACGESTSAINALANMQVGELADSATRAPHESQLN